eukprot:14730575-Alexandrium_andersonii.AAC.1
MVKIVMIRHRWGCSAGCAWPPAIRRALVHLHVVVLGLRGDVLEGHGAVGRLEPLEELLLGRVQGAGGVVADRRVDGLL